MKTYSQFAEEMTFALENLMLEGKEFGEYVKRRKKKRKQEKEKEVVAVKGKQSPRDKKIAKLARVKTHWQGLT